MSKNYVKQNNTDSVAILKKDTRKAAIKRLYNER